MVPLRALIVAGFIAEIDALREKKDKELKNWKMEQEVRPCRLHEVPPCITRIV